jgi:hypothetical protein
MGGVKPTPVILQQACTAGLARDVKLGEPGASVTVRRSETRSVSQIVSVSQLSD